MNQRQMNLMKTYGLWTLWSESFISVILRKENSDNNKSDYKNFIIYTFNVWLVLYK